MRKLLLVALAGGAMLASVPASAQVFIGADRSGAGVQVGPFGVGVGPRFGWGYRDYDYDDQNCPLVRQRIVTPRGHVVYRTRRACY